MLGNGYAISGTKTITTVNITKPTITLSTTSPTNKSITATITYPNITDKLATLVESDPWFVLSILLAYIVLFVSIVNAVVYVDQV